MSEPTKAQNTAPPLDDSLYSIEDRALDFMSAQTGIQDPEELKRHILEVQAEAYVVSYRRPTRLPPGSPIWTTDSDP